MSVSDDARKHQNMVAKHPRDVSSGFVGNTGKIEFSGMSVWAVLSHHLDREYVYRPNLLTLILVLRVNPLFQDSMHATTMTALHTGPMRQGQGEEGRGPLSVHSDLRAFLSVKIK